MTGFLNLPREVRDMVYELALVKDEILIPYNEHYALKKKDLMFRKDLPTVALLGVSKLIQHEAAEFLYGRSTWRISSSTPGIAFRLPFGHAVTLWGRRSDYFKRMVAVFDQRDMDEEDFCAQMCELRKTSLGHSRENRIQDAHSLGELIMQDCWDSKACPVAGMPNLESLSIEVGTLACHGGCCRLETLRFLLDDLLFHFKNCEEPDEYQKYSVHNRVKAGFKLTISGLHGKEEEEILKASNFPATIV